MFKNCEILFASSDSAPPLKKKKTLTGLKHGAHFMHVRNGLDIGNACFL